MGDYAFSGCNGLTSVVIGDGVTSIGDYAFSSCSGLTGTLVIPDGVTDIGSFAFEGCSGLTSVVMGDGVTSIGYYAFSGCTSLTSITLPFVGETLNGTDNTHFGYIFGAYNYASNASYVPSSLKTVVITGGDSIGNFAFLYCSNLTSVIIPDGVTRNTLTRVGLKRTG
jgi:hypothetical protein